MKTRIATLMFLLGLFLSTTAFAAEPVKADNPVYKEIKNLVKKNLEYPQFAIDKKIECNVYVSISVNDDGTLKVDCANCSCAQMKNYVIKSIEKMQTKDFEDYAGKSMLLKIKFDLI